MYGTINVAVIDSDGLDIDGNEENEQIEYTEDTARESRRNVEEISDDSGTSEIESDASRGNESILVDEEQFNLILEKYDDVINSNLELSEKIDDLILDLQEREEGFYSFNNDFETVLVEKLDNSIDLQAESFANNQVFTNIIFPLVILVCLLWWFANQFLRR